MCFLSIVCSKSIQILCDVTRKDDRLWTGRVSIIPDTDIRIQRVKAVGTVFDNAMEALSFTRLGHYRVGTEKLERDIEFNGPDFGAENGRNGWPGTLLSIEMMIPKGGDGVAIYESSWPINSFLKVIYKDECLVELRDRDVMCRRVNRDECFNCMHGALHPIPVDSIQDPAGCEPCL